MTTHAFSFIQLAIDDGLATLTLNRPERKNALTPALFAELLEALASLRRTPQVKALLLTGAGNDFCAGGDVGNIGAVTEACSVHERMVEYGQVLSALAGFDRPVIAAVDGVAYGAGFSLALAADFVLVSERARFCMAFARVGLGPDLGASWTLPRAVGLARARELIYSAREVHAQEAVALGIALEVHPHGQLHERARSLARSMANMSRSAFGLTKGLLARSLESDLATQLDAEASAQAVLMTSSYTREASARFASKQAPLYQWPKLTQEEGL